MLDLHHALVIQITDLGVVSRDELLRRVAAVETLATEVRAARIVLLRDPAVPPRDLLTLARDLRAATRAVGARLWVNDRLDVAALVEADGVHLGRRSVGVDDARCLLGTSITVSVACHDVDEVLAARDSGADAATLSPIFASPGKGAPLGVEALAAARARLGPDPRFALIALGGVDHASSGSCLAAGADGLAAIRADLLVTPARLVADLRRGY